MKLVLITVLVAALCLAGCTAQRTPQKATIVQVVQDPSAGELDSYTVVEFADGTRRMRFGTWGDVGEEVWANAYSDKYWD